MNIFNKVIISLFMGIVSIEMSGQDPSNSSDGRALLRQVSLKALRTIQKDILQLKSNYPVFGDMKEGSIYSSPESCPDGKTPEGKILLPLAVGFRFEKGVVVKKTEVDENGIGPSSLTHDDIPNGGIILTVGIGSSIGHTRVTSSYSLENPIEKLQLVYYLEEKPTNEALRKSVREIIGKNVELLKKELAELSKPGKEAASTTVEDGKK